ncbi:hypothetical protein [Streptacidiphilus fuscans]|uniref:Uncharacterized protein n=1 Tax=Streptacidiphilus fuscans TaxID=2789292 RepID=A0A931B753_9ACTN|nr:hypothetical protein [Streptacidiphilus fuscans]MBF9069083.1 hypothetical protein [Streptacidiphilus fuscans]
MPTALPVRTPQVTGHAPAPCSIQSAGIRLTIFDPATQRRVVHEPDFGQAARRAHFLIQVARLVQIRKEAGL